MWVYCQWNTRYVPLKPSPGRSLLSILVSSPDCNNWRSENCGSIIVIFISWMGWMQFQQILRVKTVMWEYRIILSTINLMSYNIHYCVQPISRVILHENSPETFLKFLPSALSSQGDMSSSSLLLTYKEMTSFSVTFLAATLSYCKTVEIYYKQLHQINVSHNHQGI